MATPVGHYLVGLAITQGMAGTSRDRKQGFALAALAVLPDLDLVAGLIMGNVWAFHRGASHSLTAALAFGLVSLLVFSLFRVRQPVRAAAMLLLVYSSHLVLDSMMLDPEETGSIRLLWPLLDTRFQAPISLLPSGMYSFGELFSLGNAMVIVREALLFLPLTALTITLRQGRLPWFGAITWRRRTAWLFAGWFAVALLATLALS